MRVSLDLDNCEKKIESLQKKTLQENFWSERKEAQEILKQISKLQENLNLYKELMGTAQYLNDILEMAEEENDEVLWQESMRELLALQKRFREFELLVLFSGPHDYSNAIVSLHAGAGGTEAQDWVEILFRMYSRWSENSGYSTEVLDFLDGDEAGIKSVTFLVKGPYAFGKLKCEEGVHRLIRISPFDSSGRRHTSFASLSVLPEINEDIEVLINVEDLRVDTYRSSGAGGQHINKTDSAVRITHLPSGIVVQCQNERSQHANRLAAMKILQARLYALKQKEAQDKLQSIKGDYKEIAWGSQIRTYTLNPFNLIKDHRTNMEIGNVQAVLDGELDDLIFACLHWKSKIP
nr:peptide chain release factor 2 [Syntrophomonas wolfei]